MLLDNSFQGKISKLCQQPLHFPWTPKGRQMLKWKTYHLQLIQSQIFLLFNYQINNYLPGSDVTPTSEATTSAKDLVIANPGIISSFSQTREGPIKFPFSSLKGPTLPPLFKILFASLGSVGLWSILNS